MYMLKTVNGLNGLVVSGCFGVRGLVTQENKNAYFD